MRLGLAGLLVLAAVAAGGVLLLGADGGPELPERRITELNAAVRAAGCELRTFRPEGRDHVDVGQDVRYRTNPPTSGDHYETPAEDGVYEPGATPPDEAWVHTLEHGRILLQYRPGIAQERSEQLEQLYEEPNQGAPSYHMVLMENNTRMPYQVAAVAWTAYVGCNQVNDRTWDALRAFRDRYVDKAPELIP